MWPCESHDNSNYKDLFMSKLRRTLGAVSLAAALASLPFHAANAEDRPVIRGAFIEFPPLAYITDTGEVEGTFIDLSEAIADRAGYDITWQELPIERVYLYLERGDIDMWLGSAGVPELAPYTRETDFHTGSIRLNAYSREGATRISSINDLQGKRLILIRGYTYWRLLDPLKEDPETRVLIAPSHLSALRMLAFKRGDYLINFQSPMDNLLQDTPLPNLQYDNLLDWPLTLVFSEKAAGTDRMVENLNSTWDDMQEDTDMIGWGY